jgi:hypothetical protein
VSDASIDDPGKNEGSRRGIPARATQGLSSQKLAATAALISFVAILKWL